MAPEVQAPDVRPDEALLHELALKLLGSSTGSEVLDFIVFNAAQLVGAGKSSISIVEGGLLRTRAKYIQPGGYFEFLRFKQIGANPLPPEAHPHLYETLRTGQGRTVESLTIHDLKERVEGVPLRERPEVFYILEPLKAGDEVIGVAALNLTRPELEAIAPRQRHVLARLLGFAAIALRNAQLIEQLKAAKIEVETIINSSADGILAFDRQCRYTAWNPAMERMTGVGRDEVIGRVAPEVFPFLKETGEDAVIRAALEGRSVVSEDRRYVIPQSGRQGYFEARYAPLRNESGEVTGGLAIVRDTTERRRAEEQIRGLARFPAENPSPVLRVSREGSLLYANEASLPLLEAWRCGVGQAIPERWRGVVGEVLGSGRGQASEVGCAGRTFSLTFAPVPEAGYVNLYGLDITERVRAGEELRRLNEELQVSLEEIEVAQEELRQQNEELIATRAAAEEVHQRYLELFEFAPDPYLTTDPRGIIREANRAAAAAFGLPPERLVGIPLATFIPHAESQDFRTRLAQVVEIGTAHDWELRLAPQGGEPFPAALTVAAVREAGGAVAGLRWLVRDITERKEAEEALRESEQRYSLAQRAAGIGSWDWDILTGALRWSEAIEPMFGFAPGRFGRTYEAFLACVHEDDRQHLIDSVNGCVDKGSEYNVQHRIVWPDGTLRWVQETGDTVRDASGRALRMLGVVQDVTERVLRQQSLEEAYHRQKAVLDSMAQVAGAPEERPSGLPFVGGVPWGTHVVALYESTAALRELLAAFVAEGLRAGELCLWVLSSLTPEEALEALGRHVPDVRARLSRGQLVLAQSRDWYLADGSFDASRVLRAWKERLDAGLKAGYAGARVTGDTSFLEPEHFAAFMDYETRLDRELHGLRAIVVCTYRVDQWSAPNLVDVIQRHDCSLIEDHGTWRLTESAEKVRAHEDLEIALDYQRAVLGSLEEVVLSLDLEGRIIFSNAAASRTFGYGAEELRRMRVCDLRVGGPDCRLDDKGCMLRQLGGKGAARCEAEFRNRRGQTISGRQTLTALRSAGGDIIGAVLVVQDVSTVRRLQDQAAYLAEEVDQLSGRHGLVAVSGAMQQVMEQVALVAPTDSTVLITGETGTGKELVARVVHDMSPRKGKPLVKVHCAALSPGLIESEFFGHEKGAFTGALNRKIGRFELADGGTILLDEVGDIPLETQVKLLRVLQEREFERVGGTRPIKVDVRVVAATNRDMEAAVESGAFRRDLYYRLNVFPVRVPPLRERVESIPVLAAHFAHATARTLGKNVEGISEEGLRALQAYDWPGNVRELRNVIERAVITSPGPVIHLAPLGGRASAPAAPSAPATPAATPEPAADPQMAAGPLDLAEAERRHILSVLGKTGWRVEGRGGAAELLKMNASTLRSRFKKLGITKPRHLAAGRE